IAVVQGGLAQGFEPLRHQRGVALRAQPRQPPALARFRVVRDPEDLDGVVVRAGELVHADDDATSRLDLALRLFRRTRDLPLEPADRKSTRLNSSHGSISYAVFCLKKKKTLINAAHLDVRITNRRRDAEGAFENSAPPRRPSAV